MAISFETIPNNLRLPLTYIEFDNSNAVSGTPSKLPRVLFMVSGDSANGVKLPFYTPIQVFSINHARELFSLRSIALAAIERFFSINQFVELFVIIEGDSSSSNNSEWKLQFASPHYIRSGIVTVSVGDYSASAAVQGPPSIELRTYQALATAINSNRQLPFSAEAIEESRQSFLELTTLGLGDVQNSIRFNVTHSNHSMINVSHGRVASTSLHAIRLLMAGLGDLQFDYIVCAFNQPDVLRELAIELSSRWGGVRQNDGICFCAMSGGCGELIQAAKWLNSPHISMLGIPKTDYPLYLWLAEYAAVAIKSLTIDPARPLQTLALSRIKAPSFNDRFIDSERNLLLYNGISTFTVGAGDIVQIERAISTYRLNKYNLPDPSYLDVETIATLSYIRKAIAIRISQKFPRHKLADDGTRFGPGQAIVTPSIIRSELLALFTELETAGLVENFDNYKNSLIVERNANDRNRIDVLSREDLVNQFRVYAHAIQFIL